MSTPNFAKPANASKYFVVLTGQEVQYKECPECELKYYEYEGDYDELKSPCCEEYWGDQGTEYKYPESYEFDDLISNLGYEIEKIGGTKETESLGDRNYPIRSIGVFRESKSYGGIEVTVKITATIQSAYYEGATLDWLVEIEDDTGDPHKYSTGSYSDDSLENIMEYVFDPYYAEINAGLCKIMQPKAISWVEKTISDIGKKLEELYEQWSNHKLNRMALFSNGEAIYTKAN